MNGICKLCGKEENLQLSHIIPKFVFSWQKETAASPIRTSQKPNVRAQDGLKIYLLCASCENLFSKWENEFSKKVFHPLQKEQQEKRFLQYGTWCLKFAVSISWRVLVYGKEKGLGDISSEQIEKVDEALETWKNFLLSDCKSPAPYDQHLIPLGMVSGSSNIELSSFINRYFSRAIDLDIAHSTNRLFTYVKMGKIMLFGLVHENHRQHWKNGKIWKSQGVIGTGNVKYVLPTGLDQYISARAEKTANISQSLSQKQKQKVQQYANKHEDQIIQSELFRALEQDIELFGDDAFRE